MIRIGLCMLLGVFLLTACAPPPAPAASSAASISEPATSSEVTARAYPYETDPQDAVFQHEELDAQMRAAITGVSWEENDHIALDELALLTLTYYGFDEKSYTGQMITAATVADDVAAIFQELYDKRYPIEKIQLMEAYEADDNRSMADNNSSAFCYREIDGTQYLSNHSFGLAIDINPVQNPYVRGTLVQPDTGSGYLDRENVRKGMITRGDDCYNAFIARGWSWGGDWTGPIDYQHFEKEI